MIQLVLISIIAFALLMVAVLLGRDAVRNRNRQLVDVNKQADATPSAVVVQLPSRVLMDRIFAEEDLTFVAGEGARSIQRQFLHERRQIAYSWLSQVRREATRILRLHVRAVRTDLSIHPVVEIQLLFHTLLFFAVYVLLWSMVSCYGAFLARSFVRKVVHLAGSLSGLGGSIVADAGRSGMLTAESQHA